MNPTVPAHSFEIYVPSHCRCGKPLPDDLRSEILEEVKATMAGWFGGGSSKKIDPRVERIQGIWDSGCGKPDEEFIDVVQSHTDESTLHERFTEFTAYVAQLANRLTQQAMACRVDGKMFIYPATADPKPHRCAGGATTTTTPKPQESGALERKMALQAALQRLGSANDARDIFCNLLHYEYQDATMPTARWPDPVKQHLAPGAPPQVIAAQNGFKIIYLQLADTSLRKASERQLVQRLVKEDPTLRGLVVVSDVNQKHWNLVNVKFDRDGKNRDQILLRRMRVGPGQPVRTAVERLSQVDVEILGEAATAADLQDKHDAAFDVEAVTKQFFSDIANWYFWALKHAQFPKDAPKEADGHDHVSLIRLITRLIFCWFLREKGLIPDTLFDRRKLNDILTGFAPDKVRNKDSIFYRAILQNLFFATLSTEMDKRKWASEEQNFMAHSLYRFKDCFQKPATALNLFKSIPFLNGGLFECLDRDLGEGKKPRYIRIDGFSRRPDSQPVVPDFLFFGKEQEIDLKDEYGTPRPKMVKVRGLIDTLRHYNFTIEENTPIEEEVALDPELSGKVFENLLAAYNPETNKTARKQSGSFYTPREIVNYMVDEALIAYLSTKLEAAIPTAKDIEPRLRHLFAYNDEPNPFNPKETTALIAAIDTLKSLDPAVGSGAFPMGLLHKLVFILGKLDPRNEQWKERQIARVREAIAVAEKIEDDTIRSPTVEELEQQIVNVNESFDRNELDYGRKLYLIENCIYGVDIQPIAVQIAKMRFFISLIVDQKIDDSLPNRGIRPLPNLETKFVAANSLIGINRTGQQMLRNETIATQIQTKETELRRVRDRHFLARTPRQKAKCREEDSRLRNEISELLQGDGWDTTTATRLAMWNPYDQNASAPFYDSEWMFGIVEGFDIVIGNPPYLFLSGKGSPVQQLRKIGQITQAEILKQVYDDIATRFVNSSKGCRDYYKWFIEAAFYFAASRGIVSYITPNTFLTLKNYEDVRSILLQLNSTDFLLDLGFGIFEAPIVPSAVFQARAVLEQRTGSDKVAYADLKGISRPLLLRSSLSEIVAENLVHVSVKNADILLYKNSLAEKIYQNESSLLGEFVSISEGEHGMVIDSSRFGSTSVKNMIAAIHDASLARYSETPIVYIPNNDCPKYDEAMHSGPRFFLRKTGDSIIAGFPATFDLAVAHQNVYVGRSKNDNISVFTIVGILCSKLLTFLYQNGIHGQKGRTLAQFRIYALNILPLPRIITNSNDVIEDLVKRLIKTKRSTQGNDTSSIEREIDKKVYALYGLTPEDIRVVEESTDR
jgi:adenine-specific DNA-methyltransferase